MSIRLVSLPKHGAYVLLSCIIWMSLVVPEARAQATHLDKEFRVNTTTATVTVANADPFVGPIAIYPSSLVQIGTQQTLVVSYSDPDSDDTHTAIIDWGDGTRCDTTSSTACSVDQINDEVRGDHTYADAGVYTAHVRVVDDDGGRSGRDYAYVVITDPAAGYLTGSGSYLQGTGLTAHFGFVSRYRGNRLSGKLKVQAVRRTDGVVAWEFTATNQNWLVIDGARAIFQGGAGTLTNLGYPPAGGYTYFVSMVDGALTSDPNQTDYIRLQIRDSAGTIVYDSQPGAALPVPATTAISAGDIAIQYSAQAASQNGMAQEGDLTIIGEPPAELLDALRARARPADDGHRLFLPALDQ